MRAPLCTLAVVLGAAACGKVPLAPNAAADASAATITTRPVRYQAIDLGTLGGSWTVPEALSDDGRVVGSSQTASLATRGFLYENGVMRELEASQPFFGNTAQAINPAGVIAGMEVDGKAVLVWEVPTGPPRRLDIPISAPENRVLGVSERGDIFALIGDGSHNGHTFIWRDGVSQELPGFSQPTWTNGVAWNRRGQVVGQSRVRHVTPTYEIFHPFLWENGVMRDLGVLGSPPCGDRQEDCGDGRSADINAQGVIVGTTTDAAGMNRAFVWENGVMRELDVFPDHQTFAEAINDRGQILGTYWGADHGVFVWDNGIARRVGTLGGVWTLARGFGENGEVVGESTTETGDVHAFVWRNGQMIDLGPGSARAINARGDVIGINGSRGILWLKTNRVRTMFIELPQPQP